MTKNTNLIDYPLRALTDFKIHGRTDESQFPLPLFWNGSAIEIEVTGSELWIDVEVDYEMFEPWAGCFINGAFVSRQMLLPGRYSLCLFRGMSPDTVKNVRFMKELQAMSEDSRSHLLIHGFSSDGTFIPVRERHFKLEFIGDSITSGEGTYGAQKETDWISMFMSANRTYALMTADALDADYRLISQGGWGVYCGWDNNPNHNLPSCYEKICGLLDGEENEKLGALKAYDFHSWKPDVIIISLGTNDASAFHQPEWTDPLTGEVFKQHLNPDGSFVTEDIARFEHAAVRFLTTVRKNNPEAFIVWTYGMLDYALTLNITNAINDYRKHTGDSKVSFLQLPATTSETVGSRSHPGLLSHKRASGLLTEYLEKLLQS